MDNFKDALIKKVSEAGLNNFGIDNYDEFRFGKNHDIKAVNPGLLSQIKKKVKKIIGYNRENDRLSAEKILDDLKEYKGRLELVFQNINGVDKDLLVSLIVYKAMGYTKVKLPRNNPDYWKALETVKKLKYTNETYDPHFMHIILEKFNLEPLRYDIKLFFNDLGVAIDFILEQYAYKNRRQTLVQAESGDVILDIGGCWGDTALYFAHKTGENGRVFSFEFIPDNIKLHRINTQLNPQLDKRIELVPHPVSDATGTTIYFKDNGPGSRIEPAPFEGQTGFTTTISIDDFVEQKGLQKVDFIKMDIEGTEPIALQGAIKTIKKYKPKLAIAIYHSMDDFVNIPKWILDLDLDYEIFIGHYTIHAEETICFARQKVNSGF